MQLKFQSYPDARFYTQKECLHSIERLHDYQQVSLKFQADIGWFKVNVRNNRIRIHESDVN